MTSRAGRPRVLVIDDQPSTRESLRRQLDLAGFDVDVSSTSHARARMRAASFELIVLAAAEAEALLGHERGMEERQVFVHDVLLDARRRRAVVRGRAVELTKQEFDVLYLLAARAGIVFSRAAVVQHLWRDVSVNERAIDAIISRLRRKIERDPEHPRLLVTSWGTGYKFADIDS